jgi:outer membrane protein assembly factor BamB
MPYRWTPWALVATLTLPTLTHADNWPEWRGASGQGICAETDLPLSWSAEKNVLWKLPLPDQGNSTPIVWGSRVFVTQATERGTKRATWCVDRKSGKVLWKKTVEYKDEEPTHKTNPWCAASAVTDGERVIVSHGSAGVFCYDLDGKELWRRDLGTFRHIWGNASSPVIWNDLCLLNCGPGVRTFLTALDKKTGKDVWKVDIPGGDEGKGGNKTWTGSWSTPVVVKHGDEELALVGYPGHLRAFVPRTGKEVWSCAGLGRLVYTSAIAGEGVAVAMSGFMGPAFGVRLGGKGDVTKSHRLWTEERPHQRVGSGVISGGHIFIYDDRQTLECIELKTGKRLWRERLGSSCWGSVVLAGDRLYAIDQQGTCFVVRASTKFEILAKNPLEERTRSSIAVSDGDFFIRTYKHLWCISDRTR